MKKHVEFVVAVGIMAGTIVTSLPASLLAANGDCSQPVSNGGSPTASDCLFILKAAVGAVTCAPECVCQPKGAPPITATDALVCLKRAVGQAVALQCPCSVTTTTTSTTTTTVPGGQPVLTAGDFPAVSPCQGRDTLPSDATFLAALNATAHAIWVVNFSQYDAQGFPEICGLTSIDNTLGSGAVSWNPSVANVFNGCEVFPASTRDIFTTLPLGHGPDLCQTGNDGFTLAMPRAGTYRKDSCIESQGRAWDVRTRFGVSGPSVDQTFASLGITRSNLRFCDGNTELATSAQMKAFLQASPSNTAFSIKSGSCNGTRHLDVTMAIICVKERTTACPAPDFGPFPCP